MRALPLLLAVLFFGIGCQTDSKPEPGIPQVGSRTKKPAPTLSLEAIQKAKDDKVEEVLLDYIESRMGDYKDERAIFDTLPKGLQMLHATSYMEAEVNNGGFHQFFWNASEEFAPDALAGLKLIGAKDFEKLMAEAIEIYARQKAAMDAKKEVGTMNAFSESEKEGAFDKLDKRFYDLGDSLSKVRVKYIRAHPEEFVP